MFNFLRTAFKSFTDRLSTLFNKDSLNAHDIKQIHEVLVAADLGTHAAHKIMTHLSQELKDRGLSGAQAYTVLENQLVHCVGERTFTGLSSIVLLVGVNGSGKTTALAKLAHMQTQAGKKVLIAAADTFRAAAVEQLAEWANRIGCDLITGVAGQDPASVVFQACQKFKTHAYDILFIDTAGRLQTKTSLMQELSKIRRVIAKNIDEKSITTLLVLDGMLGQNSIAQARIFHACTPISGIVLTKMDATAKGGALVQIVHELSVPIAYITFGENLENLSAFDALAYVRLLLKPLIAQES